MSSGLDLLLQQSTGYERTHQILLAVLIPRVARLRDLFFLEGQPEMQVEPCNGLFDIAARTADATMMIELKVGSSISEAQMARQAKFLETSAADAAYVLLGLSSYEHTLENLESGLGIQPTRISYDELLGALVLAREEGLEDSATRELVVAYAKALATQQEDLEAGIFGEPGIGRYYYYPLYEEVRRAGSTRGLHIYTVNNAGGPVPILNARPWEAGEVGGYAVELYVEFVAQSICIKFTAGKVSSDVRQHLRDKLRRACLRELSPDPALRKSGRLGEYMTLYKLDGIALTPDSVGPSRAAFDRVRNSLGAVLRSAQEEGS